MFTWTDTFVAKCKNLNVSDQNIISSQPRSSTPVPDVINSLFDNTSVSTTDFELPLENSEKIQTCESDRFNGKDSILINIIQDIESKLLKS